MVPAWERWALVSVVALLLAAGLASAAVESEHVGTNVVAGPGSWQSTYTTPAAVLVEGGTLLFQNLDLPYHNVVADEVGPDDAPWCDGYAQGACPLFRSTYAGTGATVAVEGTGSLAPGTYGFHCEPHPWMTGTLVISPDGTVTASESWTPLPNPTRR